MARAYKNTPYKRGRVGARGKKRSATQTRKGGAFGMYKSTRFSTLRAVARSIGQPARQLNPFPDNKLVKHRYCDVVVMGAAGGPGLPSVFQFRANSMFDPDFSGVGHQPMFRDEMVAQYKNYTVIKSMIKITLPAEDSTAAAFFLWCDNDTAAPASRNDLQEQHKGVVGVKLDKRNRPLVLKGWYDGPKWYKTSGTAFQGDPDHSTAAGSNPAAAVATFYNLFRYPTTDTVTLGTLRVHVEMVFWCVWKTPLDHTAS